MRERGRLKNEKKREKKAHKETHNKLINTQRIMNEIPFRIFSKKNYLKHFVLNSIYIPCIMPFKNFIYTHLKHYYIHQQLFRSHLALVFGYF